jgi:cell wall-associated NlpC family hydrolase
VRLRPEEIFHFALEAGFSPDQAVTMTAIALAESGGNPNAHNPVGEDSIGLWQVNRQAHPQFAGADGTDPLTNARMAYEVSGGGADIGRWTVTHADKGAPYLQYRVQAEAAAQANGYPDAVGQWDPPDDYYSPAVSAGPAGPVDGGPPEHELQADAPVGGMDSDADGLVGAYEEAIGTDPGAVDTDRDAFADDVEVLGGTDPLDFSDNPLVAPSGAPGAFRPDLTTVTPLVTEPVTPTPPAGGGGSAALQLPPDAAAEAPATAVAVETGGPLDTFLDAALSQDGAPYIFGAEVDPTDADPYRGGEAFDCSELVEWAAARAGVEVPDGSYNQYLHLRELGTELTVDEALHTPGALVFNFSSEPVPGGGRPSGAHVAISLGNGQLIEARGRSYGVGQFDAEGREFSHAAFIPALGTELTPSLTGLDGEVMTETLPLVWDSDTDGLINAYEQLIAIDPFAADTDRDGFVDSVELTYGTDPLDFADNPLVGEGVATGYRPPLTTDVPLADDQVPEVGWEATPGAGAPGSPGLPALATQDPRGELLDRTLDDDPADAVHRAAGLAALDTGADLDDDDVVGIDDDDVDDPDGD